ncbi:MAG: acylphosphatase, partial [Gammaproteobacteria bacterium]
RDRARRLSITGWARNLPDGRVEVLACGTPDALAAFERWLADGPRFATVSELTTARADGTPPPDFTVR